MRKLVLLLSLLISALASAQTPFPDGIRLFNAGAGTANDSILVMDSNGVVNGYIPKTELIALEKVLEASNDADGQTITNLGEPVEINDAATKVYIDDLLVPITQDISNLQNNKPDYSEVVTIGANSNMESMSNNSTDLNNTDGVNVFYSAAAENRPYSTNSVIANYEHSGGFKQQLSYRFDNSPLRYRGFNNSTGNWTSWRSVWDDNNLPNPATETYVGSELDNYIPLSEKGANNGVATLQVDGKIPSSQLPSSAIGEVYVVSSEAEMLALDAGIGAIAVREDEDQTYILQNEPASDINNWVLLRTPTDESVSSVNGLTGNIQLDPSLSAGELSITNSSSVDLDGRYYTETETDDLISDSEQSANDYTDNELITVNQDITDIQNNKEDVANKASDYTTINNTLYPTTQATEDRYATIDTAQSLREDIDQSYLYLKKVADDYKYYNVDRNATVEAYGVTPSTVKDSLGNIYTGTISNTGELFITKYYRDGRNFSRKLGEARDLNNLDTDTHNSPSILIDERPNAEYPIIVFQTDHNQGSTQYWRFTSFDIENEELPTPQEIPGSYGHMNGNDGNDLAYTHSYRWNDKIYVFNRVKNFAGGSAGPHRSWRSAYSDDNGDTWVEKITFDAEPTTGWLYMFVTQEENSPWLNLNFSSHFNNGLDGRVMYMRLNIETGELTNLQETIIGDFANYIISFPDATKNPYNDGLTVHTPVDADDNGSTPQTSTNASGNLITTFYRESKKYLSATEFDRSGNIVNEFDIDEVTDDFVYQRRLDFINDDDNYVLLFKWKERNTINRISTGESFVEKVDFVSSERDTIINGSYELGRPSIIPDHSGFLFSEFVFQSGYGEFDGNMILHEWEPNNNPYPTSETTQGAQEKADIAEQNAIDYTDTTISESAGFGLSWNENTDAFDWGDINMLGGTTQSVVDIPESTIVSIGNTTVSPTVYLNHGSSINSSELSTGVVDGNSSTLRMTSSGTDSSFQINQTTSEGNKSIITNHAQHEGIVITDEIDESGLTYDADYSPNYIDRSIPDKEYVDQAEYLKNLPNYNETTPQVLGHDGSGNFEWVDQ